MTPPKSRGGGLCKMWGGPKKKVDPPTFKSVATPLSETVSMTERLASPNPPTSPPVILGVLLIAATVFAVVDKGNALAGCSGREIWDINGWLPDPHPPGSWCKRTAGPLGPAWPLVRWRELEWLSSSNITSYFLLWDLIATVHGIGVVVSEISITQSRDLLPPIPSN